MLIGSRDDIINEMINRGSDIMGRDRND